VDTARIRYDYYANQVRPGLNLVGSYGNPGIGGTTHDPNTGAIISTGNFGDAFQQVIDRKFKNWSIGLNFSVSDPEPVRARQLRRRQVPLGVRQGPL
jgi:hypothetical protein